MATRTWLGAAMAVRQTNPYTLGGTIAAGSTFTLTINGKTATFTAVTTSAPDAATGLAAAVAASAEREFREFTAAAVGAVLTLSGPTDGTPVTVSAAAGGSGAPTITAGTIVPGTGPHDFANAANWTGGVVPATTDTIIYDGTSTVACLDNLDQHLTTPVTLVITDGYNGPTALIGRPEYNPAGYHEYRPTRLMIGASSVTIGGASGQGPQRVKLDTGTLQTSINVLSTGAVPQGGEPCAVLWKGVHVSNLVSIVSGSVGIAALAGEAATLGTLDVGGGSGFQTANVVGGTGLTLTLLTQSGGTVTLANGATSVNKIGGDLTVTGGSCGTVVNDQTGNLYWQSAGGVTTKITTSGQAITDFSRDLRARTVAAAVLIGKAGWKDPGMTVTLTTGITLYHTSIPAAQLDLGNHITLTVAPGP